MVVIFLLDQPSLFWNLSSFLHMSSSTEQTTEAKPQSINPGQLTFTHTQALARYTTDTGKILPRRITGLSAKHQRHITKAIKRGRNMLTVQ
jgi:small subunit ribosomal protein S18